MHGIRHFTFKLFILKDGKSSILYFLKVIERCCFSINEAKMLSYKMMKCFLP